MKPVARLILMCAVPIAGVGVGIYQMRGLLEPSANALVAPRQGWHRALVATERELPPVTPVDGQPTAPSWIVLGRKSPTAALSMATIARARGYAGAVARCVLEDERVACAASAGSAPPPAHAKVCGLIGLDSLGPCTDYSGHPVVLLRFLQTVSEVDPRLARASCRKEGCRWALWSSQQESAPR